ncbi:phage integrase SAM-like domain-containing protein [Faecalibacter rhinopitheci]|uniref:Site-specific integrase n=1 Tax=Faecalibacter rhinopitheci TaxID=2779678 RepID=A0A8J7KI82_9FLAO|nr:phage integrase SAM-like domain-containing protein [Faecalibacter rhinopitheci]MBF0597321.1 site-specific integrase [Faecalibacter rhinopitheci]
MYQAEKSKEVVRSAVIIQRELKLHKEVEYCNFNNLPLEDALDIINNGIPEDDVNSKILYLEKELQRLKSKHSQTKYIEFFKDFIDEYKIVGKTTGRLKISNKKFLDFLNSRGINFNTFLINDVDYELLNAYKIFCMNQGLADSSITSYFQNLKLIYREAQKRQSLYIKQDNPFDKIKISPSKREKSRDVSIKDLKVFFNLTNFSNYPSADFKFKRTVDLLKLQFLIGGHDFIEIANLKWTNIENNRVEFHRYKNRSKGGGPLINNMLHPLALDIIEEYGTKHEHRVFSFLPDPETNLVAHNQNNKLITTQLKAILNLWKCSQMN